MFDFIPFRKDNYPPSSYKKRGSAELALIVTCVIIMGLLTLANAQVMQASFGGLGSSSISLQAQQYASAKADIIKATTYDKLTAQSKTTIQNSNGFQDEIQLSPEESISDKIKQRTAIIHVYRNEEILPRFTLKVLRTSADKSSDLPPGSIIPWFGQLRDLPEGWHICDGTNGTPDLRDRFIVGTGSNYKLGDIGGLDAVKLEASEQPNHYHYFGYNYSSNNGQFPCIRDRALIPRYPASANGAGVTASKWNGSNGGNWWGWDGGGSSYLLSNLVTSLAYGTAADEAHENRPPYYALFYIMKIES